jgi:hypothetical protein
MAHVGESGQFIRVTLLDVPEYLNSADVEKQLREYGVVAHIKREYLEYHGYKIENETRHVLFSKLHKEIPSRIAIDGQEIFVSYRHTVRNRQGTVTDSDSNHSEKYLGGSPGTEMCNGKSPKVAPPSLPERFLSPGKPQQCEPHFGSRDHSVSEDHHHTGTATPSGWRQKDVEVQVPLEGDSNGNKAGRHVTVNSGPQAGRPSTLSIDERDH